MAAPRHREAHALSAKSLVRKLHKRVLCHIESCSLEHCFCAEHIHKMSMARKGTSMTTKETLNSHVIIIRSIETKYCAR